MDKSADVVVIGGGVIGGCVGYYLSMAGMKVCILERESIGSGATAHGHGSLSTVGQDFDIGPHYMLGLASLQIYPEITSDIFESTGTDPFFHEQPGISLALIEEEENIFKRAMELQKKYVDMRWIGPREVQELEPRISEKALGAVLYSHSQVDAYRFTTGLVQAIEKRGGSVLLREATGLIFEKDRVTGVKYPGGKLHCENVVLAMGAWSGKATKWIDFPIPVKPLKGEVLHVEMPGERVGVFIITARHGPIIPRKDGLLLCGSIGGVTMSGLDVSKTHMFDPRDETPWNFDLDPTIEGRNTMIESMTRIIPTLQNGTLVNHLAGVRPLSADRQPIIGPVPGLGGVYIATGHGTKGIHLAPITGKVISHMILGDNLDPILSIDTFSPFRFSI